MAQGLGGSGTGRSYGTMSSESEQLPSVGVVSPGQTNSNIAIHCENITTNIYTINSSWKQLEQAMKLIGTSKDNQGVRDKVHVTQLSANEIISQTTAEFQKVTSLLRRTPSDKKEKLQVDRLTNLFKEAVQTYSSVQKQVADKMKFNLLPSEVAIQNDSEAQLIDVHDDQKLLTTQKQALRDLEFEQSMLREREMRIKQIESDVIDVNQIMWELGALVNLQSDPINLIENQIENVQSNVDLGEQELMKAAAYQNKRRRKTLCLLTVAVTVFLIVTLVLYLAIR